MKNIFSNAYLPSVYLLWWSVYSGFGYILKSDHLFSYWILRVLCIFWITVLYQMSFASFFSKSASIFFCKVYLLILLTLFFMKQEFLILILMKSSFLLILSSHQFLCFINCAFGTVYEKSSPYSKSARFPPMLLSTVLWICLGLWLILIFVKGVRYGSRLFFLFVFLLVEDVQLF